MLSRDPMNFVFWAKIPGYAVVQMGKLMLGACDSSTLKASKATIHFERSQSILTKNFCEDDLDCLLSLFRVDWSRLGAASAEMQRCTGRHQNLSQRIPEQNDLLGVQAAVSYSFNDLSIRLYLRKKRTKTMRECYFTHTLGRPNWGNLFEFWRAKWYRRRNHQCQMLFKSFWVFFEFWHPKSVIVHGLRWLQLLQQCKHSRATLCCILTKQLIAIYFMIRYWPTSTVFNIVVFPRPRDRFFSPDHSS